MSKVLALGLAALVLAGCGASATTTTTTRTVTQIARPIAKTVKLASHKPKAKPKTDACPAGKTRDGAGNCTGSPATCPKGTSMNAAGQCNPIPSPPSTKPGKPLCSGAAPYYSAGECYATPQASPPPTPPTTRTVPCKNVQVAADGIGCANGGQVSTLSEGQSVTCPSGMAVYWKGDLYWCDDAANGPYGASVCYPPIAQYVNGTPGVAPEGSPACDPAIDPHIIPATDPGQCPRGYRWDSSLNNTNLNDCVQDG
jgi:hypothetical protein